MEGHRKVCHRSQSKDQTKISAGDTAEEPISTPQKTLNAWGPACLRDPFPNSMKLRAWDKAVYIHPL